MNDNWYLKYIAKPYILNEYDCVHLVEDVYKNELNIDLNLPKHNDLKDAHHQQAELLKHINTVELTEIDRPKTFSIVLMLQAKHLHVGVIFFINNISHVLHNHIKCGVIATRLSEMNPIKFYEY